MQPVDCNIVISITAEHLHMADERIVRIIDIEQDLVIVAVPGDGYFRGFNCAIDSNVAPDAGVAVAKVAVDEDAPEGEDLCPIFQEEVVSCIQGDGTDRPHPGLFVKVVDRRLQAVAAVNDDMVIGTVIRGIEGDVFSHNVFGDVDGAVRSDGHIPTGHHAGVAAIDHAALDHVPGIQNPGAPVDGLALDIAYLGVQRIARCAYVVLGNEVAPAGHHVLGAHVAVKNAARWCRDKCGQGGIHDAGAHRV